MELSIHPSIPPSCLPSASRAHTLAEAASLLCLLTPTAHQALCGALVFSGNKAARGPALQGLAFEQLERETDIFLIRMDSKCLGLGAIWAGFLITTRSADVGCPLYKGAAQICLQEGSGHPPHLPWLTVP